MFRPRFLLQNYGKNVLFPNFWDRQQKYVTNDMNGRKNVPLYYCLDTMKQRV